MPIFAAFMTGIIVGGPFGYKLKSEMLKQKIFLQKTNLIKNPNFRDLTSEITCNTPNFHYEKLSLENYLKKILVDDWNMSFSEVRSYEKLNVPISEPFIKDFHQGFFSDRIIFILIRPTQTWKECSEKPNSKMLTLSLAGLEPNRFNLIREVNQKLFFYF